MQNFLNIHKGCGTDAAVCELNVDTYLDEFCAQATSTIERVTTSTTTVCSVKLITTTGIFVCKTMMKIYIIICGVGLCFKP